MADEQNNTNEVEQTVDDQLNFNYETMDPNMLSMITSALANPDANVSDYSATAFLDAMRAQPDMQYVDQQQYDQTSAPQQEEVESFNPVAQVNSALNEMRRKISSWIDEYNGPNGTTGEKSDLIKEIDRNFRLSVYCYSIFQCKYSGDSSCAGSTKSRIERLFAVSKPFCALLHGNFLIFNDTLTIPAGVSVGVTLVNKVARSLEEDIPSKELDRIKLLIGILITILEPNLNKKFERDLSVSSNWSAIQSYALTIKGYPIKPISSELDQALDIIFERYAQAEFDQYHSFDSRRYGSISDASRRAILRVLDSYKVKLVNFDGFPLGTKSLPIVEVVQSDSIITPCSTVSTVEERIVEEQKVPETVWLPSLSVAPSDEAMCDVEPQLSLDNVVEQAAVVSPPKTEVLSVSETPKKNKEPKNKEPKEKKPKTKKRKIAEMSTPASTDDEPAAKKKKEPFVNQIAVQMILCHMMTTDEKYEKGVSFEQWLAFIKQYPGLIACHYKDIITDNDELIKRFRNAPRKRKDKAFFSSTGANTYSRKCDDADWQAFVDETKEKWEEFETQHAKWIDLFGQKQE